MTVDNKDIVFSILIPAYKRVYLKKAVDSILNQTYPLWELILLDDASPENLQELMQRYDDKRIKYYKNDVNVGALDLVNNWNKCLSLAQGDFIINMGDDDELLPSCLETYYDLIKKYPNLDIYHGRALIIDQNSNFVFLQEVRPEVESAYSAIWHRMNGRQQFIGDYLFRKQTLDSNGGFYNLPLAWGSDDITAFMSIGAKEIANTYMPVFAYRENQYSITSSGNIEFKMKALSTHKQWILNFVTHTAPKDVVDQYLHKLISMRLDGYFQKKESHIIAVDVATRKIQSILYWLTHYKYHHLPIALVLYGMLEGFKIAYQSKRK